jgi:heptosyltransferase-1
VTAASRSVSNLKDRTFDRILLVKPSSLGDVVHALPVLHGLRTRFPKARIDWLIATSSAPLLIGHVELDELILFDRGRYGRVGRSPSVTGEFAAFIGNLRRRRYDLVLDLQGLFRTGWITWATGAGVRIGFRDAREGAWIFYNHRVRVDDPNIHAVDRNYHMAKLLGFDEVPVEFKLAPTERALVEARDILSQAGVTEGERLVAVVPGARWETKMWLPERFVEAVDRLQTRTDARCVLLGSAGEISLCGRIMDACASVPVNLAGRTSLPQLAAVIAKADVVLCHDSAAMHLAVAFERPLVCLIGPTNPLRTGPYRRTKDVVRVETACAPCYLRRLSRCRYGHRCMRELEVDVVVATVERTLTSPWVPAV